MKKFIMLWNGGVRFKENGGNVYDMEEVRKVFEGKELKVENGDNENDLVEIGVEELIEEMIELGGCGEKLNVYCEELVERGDDFVDVSLIEIVEK